MLFRSVKFENRVPNSFMSFGTKRDAYFAANHANGQCHSASCLYCLAKVAPCFEALVNHFHPKPTIEPFIDPNKTVEVPRFKLSNMKGN